MYKISVAGAGFVGIVHAAVMANQGHKVILFDIDPKKINHLNSYCKNETNTMPIYEEGLEELFRRNYREGRLNFTTDSYSAIKESEIIFIAVGTPFDDKEGKANLSYVEGVAKLIGQVLNDNPIYKLIVDKSTVPVGTGEMVKNIIKQTYSGEFDVASNPETLAEGSAVKDALYPNRIIIGIDSPRAEKILKEIYAPFFLHNASKIHVMGIRDAELSKYAFNTFLSAQVHMTNVLANIAKESGANWRAIIPAVLGDERIGRFVHPGLGFGGSCFRKDVSALKRTATDLGLDEHTINSLKIILEQNEYQKLKLNKKIINLFGEDLSGTTIAVWGLSFKKDTNDVRDAASLVAIPDLLKRGAKIRAHDPQANEEFIKEMKSKGIDLTNLTLVEDQYETLNDSECLFITNDWNEYRNPDLEILKTRLKKFIIFDGKDLLDYNLLKQKEDLKYFSIGRPDIS
ncbi:UDP-glucose/GDP-mannose dehydrogenase family protein [Candidatus Woesearchaeota archaeon]|nr:UDP-glucose/GDP-mannose dehydrogenase family protein [Candidatus Woesearchaeota archaeon]